MAKEGVLPTYGRMFGPAGQRLLDEMPVEGVYRDRVESLRHLLEIYERELVLVESHLSRRLKHHRGFSAIQAIYGVGPIMAAIFVAEIGDASRFPSARHTLVLGRDHPSHRESRCASPSWPPSPAARATTSAVGSDPGDRPLSTEGHPSRRPSNASRQATGTMIARVAAARKLLSLVYYGLRDGEIRCLSREAS